MTEAEFAHLAGAYGADLSRWPARAQPEAAGLLKASPACRAVIAEAAALDEILWTGRLSVSPERARLVAAKILSAPPAPAPVWPVSRRSAGLFLAGMLLLGVSLGLLGAPDPVRPGSLFDLPSEGLFGGLL